MKTMNNTKIIGIDHGYGNMKTANHYFPSGILSFDAEPLFTGDMLTYNGKYYLIGEGHKEFIAEKVNDEDYDDSTVMLYIAGGGGCLVKNFCKSAELFSQTGLSLRPMDG